MTDNATVVFGASGYVGGRIIPHLLEAGHRVRAVTRSARKLDGYPWAADVEIVEADLLESETITAAVDGRSIAYYLVHSMDAGDEFQELDRRAATNFVKATSGTTLERVVYLGGLGEGELSSHLASRQEVGDILRSGSVPVVELRAAVIIGSGSLSFEMLRYLTEVLPVMVAPRWVQTKCQPIAISDVLAYLTEAPHHPELTGTPVGIGGADIVTYEEMMQAYAAAAGLRRRIILRVPVLTPSLSSHWVGLVTPLQSDTAQILVDSLKNEVVVTDPGPAARMDVRPVGIHEALERAISSARSLDVLTRWSATAWSPADPLPSDPEYAFGTMFMDKREMQTEASPESLWWAVTRIGGKVGYYGAGWAWRLRGLLDQLVGGVGLRRGRRHPEDLRVGESLDFWRVSSIERDTSLQLRAEMKLPGDAWLEWEIVDSGPARTLAQTAYFAPRGLLGRIYWFVVSPFHRFVFPGMADGIVDAARRRDARRAGEGA